MRAIMNNWSAWVTETDPRVLCSYYEALLKASGFSVLNSVEHHFTPQGFTKLWLLGESHLAIHTFPERGKTYVELSSCVDVPFIAFVFEHRLPTTYADGKV